MRFYKKIIATVAADIIIFTMTACAANTAVTSTAMTTYNTTEETESQYQEETETETEEAQDMRELLNTLKETDNNNLGVWSERELHGYGNLFYPGFEMAAMEHQDNNWATQMLRGKDISIVKASDSCLIITNGVDITQLDAQVSLFDNTLFGGQYAVDAGERVFFYDLTGDGVDELVIKMTFMDMGYRYNSVYVYDIDNLELLAMPKADALQKILDEFLGQNFQISNDTDSVQYSITDANGNIMYGEYSHKGDGVRLSARIADSSYIYVDNGKLYYKNEVQLVDANSETAVPAYLKKVCDILVRIDYNEDKKSFEAVQESITILKNGIWDASDYMPIDRDAAEKAVEEYEKLIY